ncbi:MAG: hypothetical protein Q8R36_02745, partial [bacterium]|nr:hypothetical protein [bacterium]
MGLLDKILGKKERQADITPILPRQIYEAGILELKDIIAPAALKVAPKQIHLGEKISRTFFAISYPRFLTDNWLSPIINLDRIFDISIVVHPVDTAQALRQFQKKVAEVRSQITAREEKGLVRDPILDIAYRDLEILRDKLQEAREKIFDVGLYMTLYADNEKELDKLESEIKSILESKLIYIRPALFQQEEGYKSVLPIA